jgi:hypothetical protein
LRHHPLQLMVFRDSNGAALKPRQLSLEYFFRRVRTDLLQYRPNDSTSDLTPYLLPPSTHSQGWCCTKVPRANKQLCMIVSHLHLAERITPLNDCLHDRVRRPEHCTSLARGVTRERSLYTPRKDALYSSSYRYECYRLAGVSITNHARDCREYPASPEIARASLSFTGVHAHRLTATSYLDKRWSVFTMHFLLRISPPASGLASRLD